LLSLFGQTTAAVPSFLALARIIAQIAVGLKQNSPAAIATGELVKSAYLSV